MHAMCSLPKEYIKRCIVRCGNDFRAATSLQAVPMPQFLARGKVLVRNIAVGINASDVHYAAGVYRSGVMSNTQPNDCGFESLAVVVAVTNEDVSSQLGLGTVALVSSYSAFAEFQVVSTTSCFPLPCCKDITQVDSKALIDIYTEYRRYIPLTLSGTTALISLAVANHAQNGFSMQNFPRVERGMAQKHSIFGLQQTRRSLNTFISAAAGGVGHLLIQLVQYYFPSGNIVAVTSRDKKGQWLRNRCFHSQDLAHIICYEDACIDCTLRQITGCFPSAGNLNLVFDSVGGDTLSSALRYISRKSTTVLLGSTSQYANSNWTAAVRGKNVNRDAHSDEQLLEKKVLCLFDECPRKPESIKGDHVDPILSLSSKLLTTSSTLTGFFLPHYAKHTRTAIRALTELTDHKCITPQVDDLHGYKSLEGIPDAINYLYSKRSCGKVVVPLV